MYETTAKSFRVFSRSCKNWEQFGTATKRTIRRGLTMYEARSMCKEFNDNRNTTQIATGMRYEFESQDGGRKQL